MFTRYWRHYPWYLQLLLFVLVLFTLLSFSGYIAISILPKILHFSMNDLIHFSENTSVHDARAGIALQAFTHLFMFTFPCLIFAHLNTPFSARFLGMNKVANKSIYLIVILLFLSFIPIALISESFLQSHLHFGKWADDLQGQNEKLMAAFLKLNTFPDLLVQLFTLAVLPAIGEELLFRGVLMRFAFQRSKNIYFAIGISALLFALMHPAPYGFPIILLAGILLGVVYYLTGSIYCSMLAHFVFNGTQVILQFYGSKIVTNNNGFDAIPILYGIIGFVAFIFLGYLLYHKRTPLPITWADDFLPGEEKLADIS